MATVVMISGHPGSGKTFGAYTLNPETTYMIQADRKGLSWAGWRKAYSKEKKNYFESSDAAAIYKLAKGVSEARPEVNVIMIDTLNSIMSDHEMAERKRPGYDEHLSY